MSIINYTQGAVMFAIGALLISSGPACSETEDEITISNGRHLVQEILVDPDSAKFYEEYIVESPNGQIVCGKVNAKNRYGGYNGKQEFVVSKGQAYLREDPKVIVSMANALLEHYCVK